MAASFRQVFANLASGITTYGAAGPRGLTATSFVSVSLAPPLVLVCVGRGTRTRERHQPTRRRERQMCGFRDARRKQAFLSCFGPIRQQFALPGHRMNAAYHRAVLQERFATWHGWTVTGAVENAI
ncbi:flavin reductase [Burkholderia pyrrocinia]|uniref:flavin reductase n=1 Tax=Burkholderia pyrrocinia TaxID=60550 RepID=UPI0039EF05DD